MESSEKLRSVDKIIIYESTPGATHDTIIKSYSTTTYKSQCLVKTELQFVS